MSKRRSLFQPNKDIPEEPSDDERDAIDPVKEADASVMARRKIAKPRSRIQNNANLSSSLPIQSSTLGSNLAENGSTNSFSGLNKQKSKEEPDKVNPFSFLSNSKPTKSQPFTISSASTASGMTSVTATTTATVPSSSTSTSTFTPFVLDSTAGIVSSLDKDTTKKTVSLKALNQSFADKIQNLRTSNISGDWSSVVETYMKYYKDIKKDDVPVNTLTKRVSDSQSSIDKASPLLSQQPTAAFTFGDSTKGSTKGSPIDSKITTTGSAFLVGNNNSSPTVGNLAKAEPEINRELVRKDENPSPMKEKSPQESDSDSDDSVKIEGPKFTLDKLPTMKDSPFSFKSTEQQTSEKSKGGFQFNQTTKNSAFKFPTPSLPKTTESLSNSSPAPFTFSKPAEESKDHTWSPEKGIKFSSTIFSSEDSSKSDLTTTKNTDAKTPSFNFGDTSKPFVFGSKESTTANESNSTTPVKPFTFGAVSNSDANPPKTNNSAINPFTFNSGKPAEQPNFSFGLSPAPSTMSTGTATLSTTKSDNTQPQPFTFGSSSSAVFGSSGISNTTTTTSIDNTESGNGNDDQVQKDPQVDLSEKGPGEENEDVVLEKRAKVYELVSGSYKVVGVGQLRVLLHKESHKARILVRAEGTGRVIINILLRPEINYISEGKGQVKVMDIKSDGKPATYVVRVKTESEGNELRDVLQREKAKAQ